MKWVIAIIFLLVLGCDNTSPQFVVSVERVQLLDSVPSGSGLVATTVDSAFIIGDDATMLYRVSVVNGGSTSFPLKNRDTGKHRIHKLQKHDLESITTMYLEGRAMLVAFGSGSAAMHRDSLLVIDAANPLLQQWMNAGAMYHHLRNSIQPSELNIEGAVVADKMLYLLNRGGNEIFSIPVATFTQLFQPNHGYNWKDVQLHRLKLDDAASVKPGLSGACLMEDGKILFAASIEETENAFDDGEVLGSYIGILDPGEQFQLVHFTRMKNKKGGILKDKVESLDIAGRYSNGDLKVIAVADNDDGKSKLFELRIRGSSVRNDSRGY